MRLLTKLLDRFSIKKRNWRSIERFNENWRPRIKRMAGFIDNKDIVVVDLGCGPMWLKSELNKNTLYTGVDYKNRGDGTIICDFNLGQFPNIKADVFFVSGCLEYIENWKWFVGKIGILGKKCIISYCCSDNNSDRELRVKNAWVNSASTSEIINEFSENNMKVIRVERFDTNNSIFIFEHE
jgi:hypothetical protein